MFIDKSSKVVTAIAVGGLALVDALLPPTSVKAQNLIDVSNPASPIRQNFDLIMNQPTQNSLDSLSSRPLIDLQDPNVPLGVKIGSLAFILGPPLAAFAIVGIDELRKKKRNATSG